MTRVNGLDWSRDRGRERKMKPGVNGLFEGTDTLIPRVGRLIVGCLVLRQGFS